MKLSRYILAGLVSILTLTACEKDSNLLYVVSQNGAMINGDNDEIVLSFENADALALTVYWNENGQITLSDPRVEAPVNAIVNTLQLSDTEAFDNVLSYVIDPGVLYRQFTVSELNSAAMRLGMEADVKQALYIRVASSAGVNITPTYSNVMTIYVTPYVIDRHYANVLDSAMSDTGRRMYSATENGVYVGFMGASAWYNWYLQEADGIIWGNVGDDAGGTPFALATNDLKWNFWFPGQAGSYYTVVDTENREWSALYLPQLAINGDITAEMEFNQKANVWYYTFDATAGTYNVTLSGVGKQYNLQTGTDDAAAIDTPFYLTAEGIAFGTDATPLTVTIPAAGETTISVDLNDPTKIEMTVTAGGADLPDVNEKLWVPGVDDGISGKWTFDNYLFLYDIENLSYGGAANVNALWGYYFTTEPDWTGEYSIDEGDAMSGTLVNNKIKNIPAPTPGEYVFDVSIGKLTYKLTAIETVSYAGLNDDWTMREMTRVSPCKYKAVVTKSSNTPWGVKVYINNDWNIFFGGSKGNLRLYADGFDGDNELDNGTYTLIVDLRKGTYEYVEGVVEDIDPGDQPELKEYPSMIYIPGVDDAISGSWTFDNYLIAYNQLAGNYGGVANVNSQWGYYFTTQADYTDCYSISEGEALTGQLVNNSINNIPAPTPGEYVFDVSLTGLTYKLTAIESVSYAGLNDNWKMAPMERVSPCVYEATVTKSAETPWGVKIYINGSWDMFFGGGSGQLKLFADGFDGDNDLATGDYILRVDLAKATYSYTAK